MRELCKSINRALHLDFAYEQYYVTTYNTLVGRPLFGVAVQESIIIIVLLLALLLSQLVAHHRGQRRQTECGGHKYRKSDIYVKCGHITPAHRFPFEQRS